MAIGLALQPELELGWGMKELCITEAYKEKYTVQNEHSLIQNKDEFRQNLKDTRKEILDNAYLMTYEMRETIRKYLETTAKEYKVKGLFNKEKKKEADMLENTNGSPTLHFGTLLKFE